MPFRRQVSSRGERFEARKVADVWYTPKWKLGVRGCRDEVVIC
jgi:hypothetical protein